MGWIPAILYVWFNHNLLPLQPPAPHQTNKKKRHPLHEKCVGCRCCIATLKWVNTKEAV